MVSGSCVLASDLGSGSCKTVLLDPEGRIVGSAGAEYTTHYPRPGWAEQDPEDWYRAFTETVRRVLDSTRVAPREIARVGLVGVTHNTVLLDQRDRPLRKAILTFDGRSEAQCRRIDERWGNRVPEETLNSVTPLWSHPQLLWVRENEPQVWRRTARILFQKDYVRHRLAPGHATDRIDAIGSLLFDPRKGEWIADFCAALGLAPEMLPALADPLEVVAEVGPEGARDTGLAAGTPVIAGTTDTAAEAFGSGLLRPGQGYVKLASVGRLAVIRSDAIRDPRILNYRYVLDGLWYPGSGTKSAATAPRWLRDRLWENQSFSQMDEAAAAVPAGSEGLIFHPHLLGEWAPHWDEHLRANFIGATMRHGRAHFTRAVLEGVAFSLRDALERLAEIGLAWREYRLIGGGARSRLWAGIVCDVLGRELIIPAEQDAAYGAALLTGLAAGFFGGDPAGVESAIRIERRLEPERANAGRYEELFAVYREADSRLAGIAHRLSELERRDS